MTLQFDLTLREIDKIMVILAIYYGSLPPNLFTNEFLTSLLAVLKIKRPSLYQRLKKMAISISEFLSEVKLDNLQDDHHSNGISPSWARDILQYCLMSDEELKKATTNSDGSANQSILNRMGGWTVGYNLNRENIVPFLCGQLDRFSTKPK